MRRITLGFRSEHALCSSSRPGRSRLRTGSPGAGVRLAGLRQGPRRRADRDGFGRGRSSPAMDFWMKFAGRGTGVGV